MAAVTPQPNESSVNVHIEADINLEVQDLWPDGDAPNPVTAADVLALMESQGSKTTVLQDWCLMDEVDVHVSVQRPNPAWSQDEVLIGEPPKRWLNEYVWVWEPEWSKKRHG